MTIAVYKKGNSVTVRGIECDVCRCEFLEMEDKLNNGWVKDPSELVETEETKEVETPKQLDPIRQKAKDAGIDGWDKKRIKTLEAELNGNKD